MNDLVNDIQLPSARLQLQRKLCGIMTEPIIVSKYMKMWREESNPLWSESDYTTAAYELAVRLPQNADSILAAQRARITNPDRQKQFDYISRACTADTARWDELFNSLRDPANRLIEPYAQSLLYYLNHPTRDVYATRYIEPGLEMLSDVQRTGDIFFPAKWAEMLLSGHRCAGARAAVEHFLANHPDYPTLLKNKILQAAHPLTHQ
jgi:aminopeptidase N